MNPIFLMRHRSFRLLGCSDAHIKPSRFSVGSIINQPAPEEQETLSRGRNLRADASQADAGPYA